MNTSPKILVVKVNAIGDVLTVTPALSFIKKLCPNSRLDFLVGEWSEPAIRNNPSVNCVIKVDEKWLVKRSVVTFWKIMRLFFLLKSKKYDAVLGFHRSKLLQIFFRCLNTDLSMFFSVEKNDDCHISFDEEKHFLQNNMSLAYALCNKMGFSNEILDKIRLETETQMHWYVLVDEQEEAKKIIASKGINEQHRIICIVPGGGNNPMRDEQSYRQWGSNKFKYLIDKLSKLENTHILILGSKNEEELGLFLVDGNEPFVSNLAGIVSLRIAAAILSKAALVITNDTGPMHIAGALGIPLLAIFGPTGAKEKLPPTSYSIGVQSSLHCSPCYYAVFRGCIYNYPKCMSTIYEDKVYEIAKEVLNKPQVNIQYGFNHYKIIYS